MSIYKFIVVIFYLIFELSTTLFAQLHEFESIFPQLDSLVIQSNSSFFSTRQHIRYVNRKPHLIFEFFSSEQSIRGELFLKKNRKESYKLLPSPDFEITDSLKLMADGFYRFQVKFKQISDAAFPAFTFDLADSVGIHTLYEIPLFPYTQTKAVLYPGNEDLYLGESRSFELISNNPANLILDGEWKTGENFDYRLLKNGNAAVLFVEPKSKGEQVFQLQLETKKPFIDSLGRITSKLPLITHNFTIKNSRHVFLRMDVREITRDPSNPKGTEVQIETNRKLQLGKTYRVEAKEEVGTPLIAEIFTKTRLNNDRILCEFRPYADHAVTDGYLFIKDGDTPIFMTNVAISPLPSISKVSVLRYGEDWSESLFARPGETIDLRIEGKDLLKANYLMEDLKNIGGDSLNNTDLIRNFRYNIPLTISKRSLTLFDGENRTGVSISIREYNRPKPLDFVFVDYGNGEKQVDTLNHAILYPKTIKDVVISFKGDKIDSPEMLYGKQQIQIRVRMEDKNGGLIETRNLGNFTICPNENSPRYSFYPRKGCRMDDISLNSYLTKKTYSLDEWAKVELIIEHVPGSYETEGYSQRVVIYQQKSYTFDVDVSIPAGLITQKIGKGEKLSPLFGGIGFAMMAQFSFYKEGEIQQLLPVKVGLGFLAQNAFNFNQDAERDLGIVLIGSVYPLQKKGKLNFPLYGGFGYFMQEAKFFFLVGPGIRVSF
jgi:hypothetical protein